jgi:hypothetical protein
MIFSARNFGDSRSQIARSLSISSGSDATAAGSNGSGRRSEKAVTRVLPLALGNTSTVIAAPFPSIYSRKSACDAEATEEVGSAGADHAAAADHNAQRAFPERITLFQSRN